ncbi:unnamed protein product, partial [Rotaria magnacalcarata]
MNLRERNFPPHYWLQLHNHTINPLPSPPAKKPRHLSKIIINKCLAALSPHIQKFIYGGAIDKRKGEVRSNKFPLSPEQFAALKDVGVTHKYEYV